MVQQEEKMRFRTRLKIAYDMCMKQLMSFRISTILLAVTLIMFGIIIYQLKASFNYRLMVEKGFLCPLDNVYYLTSDLHFDSKETYPDISKIEGISNLYKHQVSYNTSDCLQFLSEVNCRQNSETGGIEEIWLFASDFDIYNVKLVEGIQPSDLNPYEGIPLYLSEEYKVITELGEHYKEYDSNNKLMENYYVAGYFSSDSVIPNANVCASNQGGIIPLKYGIIELAGEFGPDGYFTVNDGYSIDDVKLQIQKEWARSSSIATISNVDGALSCMEKNVVKSLRYLVIATILLVGTSIIVLLVIQVGNILTRGREYGIWMICNATHGDILKVLILQNFIRFIYAEAMAVLFINLITRMVLYGENFPDMEITHKISNRIIALNIYPVIIIVGLLIAAITVIAPAIKLSRTEPVKLIKGEL